MSDMYAPCPCGSGRKFKFCCYEKRKAVRGVPEDVLARRAAEFPASRCYVNQNWDDLGLAHVVVMRQLPDGSSLVGGYLVDTFCMGVKASLVTCVVRAELHAFLKTFPGTLQEISYEDARSIILGAVEFAGGFGFSPDENWDTASPIVESGRPFDRKFEFGRNGQPFYIQGPGDPDADDIFSISDDESVFEEQSDKISSLLERGDFEAADRKIDELSRDYPERWEPLLYKASCLALQGQAEKAIPLLEQAIAIKPSAEAYFNLASAHKSIFHLEEWIACLQKVVELDGRRGDIGKRAAADIEEFASSIRETDGISLDEFFEAGHTFKAALDHLSAGRLEDAVRGFSEVLKVRPRHVQSHGNLGLAYAGLGDRGRALGFLDTAISLDPGYQPAIDNRKILMNTPPGERLALSTMRIINFYEDKMTARRSPRPAVLRVDSP
jgi:tetratricopeptide (TPR) repeat protein